MEEVKFQFDCLHRKLYILYLPIIIANMHKSGQSQWFHGYSPRFFLEQGWASRRLLGLPLATLYSLYYVIRKHSKYKDDCSFLTALRMIMIGAWNKQSVYNK